MSVPVRIKKGQSELERLVRALADQDEAADYERRRNARAGR
jgi:hypothetical protein